MTCSSSQPICTLVLFVFSLACLGQRDGSKSPTTSPEPTAADRSYRAGKFADAEAGYRALLQRDPAQIAAQVGLVRSMLRQQKIDESFEAVNAYLAADPNSADLLTVKGDLQFRRGEMSDAQNSYLAALKIDPKGVKSYLGLAHLYSSFSLYRKAYAELQTAHSIAPDDIEVERVWFRVLPRKERMAALERYLSEDHPDNEDETQWMKEYLEFLKATVDKPAHACKLVSRVEQTETKLEPVLGEDHRRRGIGLTVKLDDRETHLQLDTGAGGLVVSRKVAEKAGLTPISAEHYAGVGDKGPQTGYRAVADHIQIGALEFQDCVISVSAKTSVADGDGLIGADVFGSYLVDIDLPGMRLKLSPLPKRPEDAVAPKALNSEGEEQANAEQKEESAAHVSSDQQISSEVVRKATPYLPKDRYIAPEMADWTKVFRFSHTILVPTWVNDLSNPVLFGLDTGAFANVLSLRAAKQLGKVDSEYRLHVKGVNGEVKKVYSARATLRFGHLHQPDQDIVTFDLSSMSRQMGTEVSGFLGFAMLRILEVKIDYRDGLVDFVYDPKRVSPFLR